MQYNLYQGVSNTPAEKLAQYAQSLKERNLLPAAVASVMVLWISLLLINVMQQLPVDPGAATRQADMPAQTLVASTATGNATNDGKDMVVTRSADSGMTVSMAGSQPIVASSAASTAAPAASGNTVAASDTDTTVGGRGAEEPNSAPAITIPEPEAPVVPTPSEPVIDTPATPPIIDLQPTNNGNEPTGVDANINLPPVNIDLGVGL